MNINNIDFGFLGDVECENCGHIINDKSPIFDRILAKYLGFCYECMQDYENKHSSTLDKEKIKLANLVQELQGIGEEQVASFYPIYLMYKSGKVESAILPGLRIVQRKDIAAHLNTWVSKFKALDDTFCNKEFDITNLDNTFYNEGFDFGSKAFQVMDANMKALGASQDLNSVSFDVELITEDIKEAGGHLKNKLVEIDTQGSNMIKNTNDLLEKKKFYYVIFGVLSNMYGVTKAMNIILDENQSQNMPNIELELPDSIQCANCGHVVDKKSPMFSRILAKYFGFCYDCIQDYENKHNSALEQEKVQLAEYLKDGVERLCNQLRGDLFPTFLMQKAFQQYLKDKYPFGTIDSYALIMEKKKFYGSNFEKDMQDEATRLLQIVSEFIYKLSTKYYSDIENLKISKNEFYNEGLNLGLKIFHIMLANQSLNTNSFNRGQILNNLGETVFIFESVIYGFIDKGLSIIMNNANGLAEKRKVYCAMVGVMTNIYGQIKGMLNSNPSGK